MPRFTVETLAPGSIGPVDLRGAGEYIALSTGRRRIMADLTPCRADPAA